MSENRAEAINKGFEFRMSHYALPKISPSQSPPPVNMQRARSLNGITLPRIGQRTDSGIVSGLTSPVSLVPKMPNGSISSPIQRKLPSLPACVRSNKPFGIVHSYCANTHRGIIRDHNEDRVMIMLRIPKPADRKDEKWPHCSFFGLYDGHGGKSCSNFLRDNLHLLIIQEACFPADPQQAIIKGFEKAESMFVEMAMKRMEKSGSCAVIILIVGKKAYVANLGDSRAVMSCGGGAECNALTKDHKPDDEYESQRVVKAGGSTYYANENAVCRIMPGRLAVSRAFGDIEAKVKELGGNPHVLIAVPEIRVFYINKSVDFIAIGSDGIFDRLSNKDIVDIIFDKDTRDKDADSLEKLMYGVNNVLIEAMNRSSYDNITLLVVCFEGFSNFVKDNNV